MKCLTTTANDVSALPLSANSPSHLPTAPESLRGNLGPEGFGGKLAFCVASQKEVLSIGSFFAGYPGAGTVYCMAHGLWCAQVDPHFFTKNV